MTSASVFAYDLVPLWELHADVIQGTTVHDTFYTTYGNDKKTATDTNGTLLYANWGVAAWVPCSKDTVTGPPPENATGSAKSASDVNQGYENPLIPYENTAFACAQPTGTAPLYRLYKGAPAYDHVFTTSSTEWHSLVAQGYEFDRVDGYVFTTQISGTVALYRLSTGVGIPNHDIEHRFTISSSARQSLLNNGWTDEGTIGYVFPAPTATSVQATGINGHYNGVTVTTSSTTTVPTVNVTPPIAGYSAYAYGNASNTTVKPNGAVWQEIDFQLYTGDIFNLVGSAGNFTHLVAYLHYRGTPSKSDLCCIMTYDGLALAIGSTNSASFGAGRGIGPPCAAGDSTTGQLYFEFGGEGRAFAPGKNLLCDPKLNVNLQNNTTYKFTYFVDDAANVKINVDKLNPSTGLFEAQTFVKTGTTTFTESLTSYYPCPLNPAFGTLAANQSYCVNPESGDHWPSTNTGYMMDVAWDKYPNTPDNTATISLVHHHWWDGFGHIIN